MHREQVKETMEGIEKRKEKGHEEREKKKREESFSLLQEISCKIDEINVVDSYETILTGEENEDSLNHYWLLLGSIEISLPKTLKKIKK